MIVLHNIDFLFRSDDFSLQFIIFVYNLDGNINKSKKKYFLNYKDFSKLKILSDKNEEIEIK